MADTLNYATVTLWDQNVGTLEWDDQRQLGRFTYASDFLQSGLPVSPITAPLGRGSFAFPELNDQVFKGLPGFVADSLPDKFGNRVLSTWRAVLGETATPVNPLEQLRIIGRKGMGALEYGPEQEPLPAVAGTLNLPLLVQTVNLILSDGAEVQDFSTPDLRTALDTLSQIGISADGSRAKAIIGLAPDGSVCAGHDELPAGYEPWLLKFDGITGNRDREADDPQGWGQVEYAYYLMARRAGIDMSECRLFKDGERKHFITRRFDRYPDGTKLHRQSLCAIDHMDFDALGTYSYEEVLDVCRTLELPQSALVEQFRRAVFNVLSRNHDDHAKNIAFLMNRQGQWSLAPAYDLTFAYNPEGHWTRRHQMTLNAKREDFEYQDLLALATYAGMGTSEADTVISAVAAAVHEWPNYAEEAGVTPELIETIGRDLRLHLTA